VHFYSAFYEQSQNWWQGNSTEVIPQINQYWERRNQRPVYVVSPPPQSSSRVSPPKQHSPTNNPYNPYNPTYTNNNYNNNQSNNNNGNTRYNNNEPGL